MTEGLFQYKFNHSVSKKKRGGGEGATVSSCVNKLFIFSIRKIVLRRVDRTVLALSQAASNDFLLQA